MYRNSFYEITKTTDRLNEISGAINQIMKMGLVPYGIVSSSNGISGAINQIRKMGLVPDEITNSLNQIDKVVLQLNKININKIQNLIGQNGMDLSKRVTKNLVTKLNENITKFDIKDVDTDSLDEMVTLSNEITYVSDSNIKQELDLASIENIISLKLDEFNKENNQNSISQIIYWFKKIVKNQECNSIGNKIKDGLTAILVNVIVSIITPIIISSSINGYHALEKYINTNTKQTIKIVKREFKKCTFNSNDQKMYDKFMYINKDKLEVRTKNNIKSYIFYRLEAGSIIEVISKNKEWVMIKFIDRNIMEEKCGWVLSKYLKKFKTV